MNEQIEVAEALLNEGVVTFSHVQTCIATQHMLRHLGQAASLTELLVSHGFASRDVIDRVLRRSNSIVAQDEALELPFDVCMEYQLMPLGLAGASLRVAPRYPLTPSDCSAIVAAARQQGLDVDGVEQVPRNLADILKYLQAAASSATELLSSEIEQLWRNPDDGELLQNVLNHVFVDALQARASDVHIKLSTDNAMCKILYRVDGELDAKHVMPTDCMRRLVTQIKLKAGMDASERLRPQDGRMSLRYHSRAIDLRVACSAKDDGELVVVRLLDQSRTVSLGMMLDHHPLVLRDLEQLADLQGKRGGLVLVTGPTGMGKSTTMSALIRAMPRDRFRVATVEDPVENRVPYVDHMSINEAAGLGYPEMLRALLRQDPDVIVIGEVRDKATAEIALRAVETGHMVLTTLHTRSVRESVVRLVSMLPESYRELGMFALANNLKAVVNQTLVKKLCTCAARGVSGAQSDVPASEGLLSALGMADMRASLRQRRGCPNCGHTGYSGRVMVPEAAFFSSAGELRQAMRVAMSGPVGLSELLSLPGVTYVSREESLRHLLAHGICDLAQAAVALDLMPGTHANVNTNAGAGA